MIRNQIARFAVESIESGIYVGMVVLDANDLDVLGDDDVAAVEKAIRKAGGRSELDDDGDLIIRDVE
ncbi:MAG: hypothetical protein EBR34_15300 [Sphingomonadaceae bacterium]|nr:hypothetical protein [Sphingomonadaceae bacterium]